MKPRTVAALVLVVTLGVPSIASANAGTPLIWATMLHMVFGNACIGLLEGALVAGVYRVPEGRAIGLMVLANYFSAWLGWVWLPRLLELHGRLDLYNAWQVLWGMVAVAYVVTLVLEWPFAAGCFRGKDKWFRRSCSATILVQSVSYILLFGWYGVASGTSLLTETSIVPVDQISLPANVRVYFIADDDGDVYRRELGTGRTEKVYDLSSTDSADCLSLEKSPSHDGFQDLVVLLESADFYGPKVTRIGIEVLTEDCPRGENGHPMRRYRFARPGDEDASRLGSAFESPWEVKSGYWPIQGLSGENSKTNEHFRFSLETLFVQWEVRHATLLPNDQILFQLGKQQICILEIKTRKIAVLCFGRGAVAVLEQVVAPAENENKE